MENSVKIQTTLLKVFECLFIDLFIGERGNYLKMSPKALTKLHPLRLFIDSSD